MKEALGHIQGLTEQACKQKLLRKYRAIPDVDYDVGPAVGP